MNGRWRLPDDMYDLRASLKFLAIRHGKTSGEDGPRGQSVDSAFAATFARAARRLIEREYLTWCRWHDPSRSAERAEWAKRGGRARSNKARARRQLADAVMSITDLDAFLCASLTKVAAGKMEPNVANAVATLAKSITAIRTAGEMERRLEQLERVAGIGGEIRRIG